MVAGGGFAVVTDAPVLFDFESKSRADLKKVGGRLYWAHPSTTALSCAWHDTADGTEGVWFPGEVWPHHGRTIAAHNWKHFDRFGADKYGFDYGGWEDTSDLARRNGLPGKLDELGKRLGYPKDAAESRFTIGLSTVRRPPAPKPAPRGWAKMSEAERYAAASDVGHVWISPGDWKTLTKDEQRVWGVQKTVTDDDLARVVAYNKRDVEIMVRAWPELEPYVDVDTDVGRLDAVINDRGVYIDADLMRAMLVCDARRTEDAIRAAATEAGIPYADMRALASRPKDIADVLGLANADKAALAPLSWHPVVKARQALASIVRGKMLAGLARRGDDGRMRDAHQYYAGHTGRWGGRGMQTQNLTRPIGKDRNGVEREDYTDDDISALVDAVVAGRWLPDARDDAVLQRATICAAPGKRISVVDFSAIEGRGTAWAAGDEDELDVYRSGRDPYKVAATQIYDVAYDDVQKWQRTIGKVAVLALGYQGGVGAFSNMASGSYGVDLTGLDVQGIVDKWRAAHRPIVSLWYACQRAFIRAVETGRSSWVGPWQFVPGGDDVAVFLPSGRPLVYRDADVLRDANGRATCTHFGQIKAGVWGVVHTYGGKLVENLVQATCRDFLAEAMLVCEAVGLPTVMHVHDENVVEVDADAIVDAHAEHMRIFHIAPKWAPDFPLKGAGFMGRRYRK